MKQLVVDQLPPVGEEISLQDDQRHYLFSVRRASPGDEIVCIDEAGHRGIAVVTAELNLRCRSGDAGPPSSSHGPTVTFYVALLKGKKMDTVVRQLTELGVTRIVPAHTRHCVSRPGERELERKITRWQDIAREATQQSGRRDVPQVLSAVDLTQGAPKIAGADRTGFVFHETAGSLGVPKPVASEVLGFVGPEGGLAAEEVNSLVTAGWHPVRMPFPVLRAETAAVAAATLVQYLGSEYTADSTNQR